jgi:hypothetical protein
MEKAGIAPCFSSSTLQDPPALPQNERVPVAYKVEDLEDPRTGQYVFMNR